MRHRRLRQAVAAVLVVIGGTLLLLAPSVGPGLLAFAIGVVIEVVGIALERRDHRAK